MSLLDINLQEDVVTLGYLCVKEFRRVFNFDPEWEVIYEENKLLSLDDIVSSPQQYIIAGHFDGQTYAFFIKIFNMQDNETNDIRYWSKYPQLTLDKILKNI